MITAPAVLRCVADFCERYALNPFAVRLGYVVDFVDAGIGSLRFWTFNVADASISLAILLLLAASLWPWVAGPRPIRSDA